MTLGLCAMLAAAAVPAFAGTVYADETEVQTEVTELDATRTWFSSVASPVAGYYLAGDLKGDGYYADIAWAPASPDGIAKCNTVYTCVATVNVFDGYEISMPDSSWIQDGTAVINGDKSATYVFKRTMPVTERHQLVKVEGTKPTAGNYGSSSYYECEVCGKLFADANAETETTMEEIQGVNIMYRLFNPYTFEHFYTANKAERDHLINIGWNDEGIGWVAPKISDVPVYRLYNPTTTDHHYTSNAKEKDWLAANGWNYEGIGWYSDNLETVPVYRQYCPILKTGSHNFTVKKAENDWLVKNGWNEEGISWHGRAVK